MNGGTGNEHEEEEEYYPYDPYVDYEPDYYAVEEDMTPGDYYWIEPI